MKSSQDHLSLPMSNTQSVESLIDLPQNILLEILVRLPLKTLFACKCVCTTFLNLLSPNPHFFNLHSSNATQALVVQFGSSRLLRLLDPELDVAPQFRGNFVLKPIFKVPKFRASYIINYRSSLVDVSHLVLVNSCNGLLYFVSINARDERSLVYNPITNEYVVILDVDPKSRLKNQTMSMWLGFSRGTNQYKVLRIFGSVSESVEMGAELLVVGSDSWREIKDTPLGIAHSWETCFTILNGVIYWIDNSRDGLVFFDFETEMFGEIKLPPEFENEQLGNKQCISIGVLGECLSVSYNAYYAYRVGVWVLKKPGDPESWSKEFSFGTMTPTSRPIYGQFKPLQILRSGEIMLWFSEGLVCYDPKNKSVRYAGFDWRRLNPRVVDFTPTFISLKDTLLVDKIRVQHERPRGNERIRRGE